MKKSNPIVDKSFDFAVDIVTVCKELQTQQKEFVLSRQLLRSGTAIGALIRESQNGESKKDFIHKLSISQKECDETMYWLDLLHRTEYLSDENHNQLHAEATQLLKLLKIIINSIRRNL